MITRLGSPGAAVLDEPVDYIQASTHLPHTLSDLEERSHYSPRHLQTLFRETSICTLMQFVRCQRLAAAMDKPQTAGLSTTASAITRDCGYCHTSNFSSDSQWQFGVTPSSGLRRSLA